MKHILILALAGALFTTVLLNAQEQAPTKTTQLYLNFETISAGKIPAGWKVEATNQRGPLATWQVVCDTTAPSGSQALSLTSPNHIFGGTFNLCWTERVRFLNGAITVHFKANSGEEDQGGGVIWRAKDRDNYYIARYNPLENNFRIYYVKDGARRLLASARLKLPAHIWHTMKIVQRGKNIEGYLNGKKYLAVKDDTFDEAGGAGLWTKADAATSFDDFKIETAE